MKWFKLEISNFLNKYVKITYVILYFKRWWNDEVAQAKKV